jgi:hypothetical protein
MIFQHWGATPEEINGHVIGDDICTHARVICTRSISLKAPPHEVFPWIRQMGFGRAGWYSYDFIDNLGRKSAASIEQKWQDVHTGSLVPGGPIQFVAALVDTPHSFVLQIGTHTTSSARLCFTLAYDLRPQGEGTRLVTRMRARVGLPGGKLIERFLLGPGDGVMLRKQLLTLAQRVHNQ